MAISLSRYVNITSGLGAGAVATTRTLVGRLFTANSLIPPQTFLTFSTAAEVGNYFGTSSEEYYRALFYFSFTSKNLEQPQSIQYARWVNAAVAPKIYGISNTAADSDNWTSVTAGSLGLTINGVSEQISAVNFSTATSLDQVATLLTSAIQTQGTGVDFTSAVVTYNTSTSSFDFVGGATGNATISVQAGITGTDITSALYLGWLPQAVNTNGVLTPSTGAIWSNGSAIESITTTLTNSANLSNNFGSFLFLNNLNLNLAQIKEAATWNQAENVLYLYTIPVSVANAAAYSNTSTGVGAIGGCALTLQSPSFAVIGTTANASVTVSNVSDTSRLLAGMTVSGPGIPDGATVATITNSNTFTLSQAATAAATVTLTFQAMEFPEQLPMMVEAATNYLATNSVQNYMFQQVAGLTPSVTTDASATSYDALSINYYGQTQTAGSLISFYQRGLMQGASVSTNITDMTSYVNEIWFKDANAVAVLNLLLGLSEVPANNQGRSQILSVIQSVINLALINGTISVNKILTSAQKSFISSITGDEYAWYQVQNSGYWIDCVIIQIPNITPIQYQANYTLIYSKNDVIRLVVGTQELI